MSRSINVFVPETDREWVRAALEALAADVLTDEERGQRGAGISVLVRMLASAYIGNVDETARLVREIKALTPSP